MLNPQRLSSPPWRCSGRQRRAEEEDWPSRRKASPSQTCSFLIGEQASCRLLIRTTYVDTTRKQKTGHLSVGFSPTPLNFPKPVIAITTYICSLLHQYVVDDCSALGRKNEMHPGRFLLLFATRREVISQQCSCSTIAAHQSYHTTADSSCNALASIIPRDCDQHAKQGTQYSASAWYWSENDAMKLG